MTEVFIQSSTNAAIARSPLTMQWVQATTPLEAIERALYALADQVSGTIAPAEDAWSVTLHPRPGTPDGDQLEHRMRQQVTDHTLRLRIAERTDPIRNLVFAVAFSSTQVTAGGDPTPLHATDGAERQSSEQPSTTAVIES